MPAASAQRWSLESWFPSFRGPEYHAFRDGLAADIAAALASEGAPLVERLLRFEGLSARFGHLAAYLGCLAAEDASREEVKSDEARLAMLGAELAKLRSALQAAVAGLAEEPYAQLLAAPALEGAGHAVALMRLRGLRQMEPALESLSADLAVDGFHSWGRLYTTLSAKLSFEMVFPDGRTERVPMARRRALMADPDRRVRTAAFTSGQAPWEEHQDTMAAALNAIAGTRLVLYRRRGCTGYLEAPLVDAGLSRETLEAMLAAIHGDAELPRRILRQAARLQGTAALDYCDLEAPQVPAPEARPVDWASACATVDRAFTAAYPALGDYFREMLRRRWIESEPRPNKSPGAFCTGSLPCREERVFLTHHDTIHDVVTLAHEVGHAWHARVLGPARPLACDYPMTLAETASNFGEMILLEGLASDPAVTPGERAYLLDQELLRASAYLLNIPMRYLFEKRFYEERQSGEVSAGRLRSLMVEAQREVYADALRPGGEDPLFWSSKMHFFITEVSFYNFPYVFGYLLGQALFARFREEGPSFLPRYESFLGLTGSASCEEVARRTLGVELRDSAFWSAAVRAIAPAVEAYERLAPAR